MKVRLVTAGAGAAWEAALVQACQAGQVGAQVLHRCYDLGDLLAVAAAGQAEVAVVAAGTRWLDRDATAPDRNSLARIVANSVWRTTARWTKSRNRGPSPRNRWHYATRG